MDMLGFNVLTPAELKQNDVVAYFKGCSFPFCDMKVHRFADNGVYLRRPYITNEGEAKFEECYWHNTSNFLFKLIHRDAA